MAICYEDGALARFAGAATVEEALDFAGWLAGTEAPQVDLAEAGSIHAAVLQCLLAFRPTLHGLPADAFLSACLADLPKATPKSEH
ncbi:hypothetical protein ACTTAI_18990 [Rhodobacter capsulatus]|uniref:hypothetical protein n=1 Tax=Rhodobacter capsulatus TaxID=1061 RepID=UPI004025C74B